MAMISCMLIATVTAFKNIKGEHWFFKITVSLGVVMFWLFMIAAMMEE